VDLLHLVHQVTVEPAQPRMIQRISKAIKQNKVKQNPHLQQIVNLLVIVKLNLMVEVKQNLRPIAQVEIKRRRHQKMILQQQAIQVDLLAPHQLLKMINQNKLHQNQLLQRTTKPNKAMTHRQIQMNKKAVINKKVIKLQPQNQIQAHQPHPATQIQNEINRQSARLK